MAMPLLVLIGGGLALLLLIKFTDWYAKNPSSRIDFNFINLEFLKRSGYDLKKEHNLHFYLYHDEKYFAEKIADELTNRGFEVSVKLSDEEGWLCSARKRAVPEYETITSLDKQIAEIAGAYDADYEGWGIKPVKDD
jgi:regulator of RNase E activity RraB